MRLGITECWDGIVDAASTAKANQTAQVPKAGSPIERDVGNYEQVVKCWDFLQRKQILTGEARQGLPKTTKVGDSSK